MIGDGESVARERAFAEVRRMVHQIGVMLDGMTAQEAAARAWRRGGPSIEDLTQLAIARGCRDASPPDVSHTTHTPNLEAMNERSPESPLSA